MSNDRKTIPFPFGPCRICQDNATGVHYGVVTCEGCKGFFKRITSQRAFIECYFGGRCLVNIETRNRCKSCRFRRCIEEGMSMDSVKMGRIPKKIKEQALRERQKHFDSQSNNDVNQTSSVVAYVQYSSELFPCVERLTTIDDSSRFLSSLCLPSVLYTDEQRISYNHETIENLTASINSSGNIDQMTVSKFISKVSENILIDYMFSCEIRFANNVLRTMKYLSPKLTEPFLIYELDFQLTSFFRYLRWKMFKIYSKHTVELQRHIQRMFGIINLKIVEYPGIHASIEQMWSSIQNGISKHVKQVLDFVEDTPGLNELNQVDLKRILTNRILDFWIMMNYPLFYKDESYMMTVDGLQYTRFFMNKFIGKTMTDALHEFSSRLQVLNITQIEHSLIIPIVLCRIDPDFVEVETVKVIRQSYLYALYVQMSATRTEGEAKSCFEDVFQIIEHFAFLDDLYRKNIRDLVIEKAKTD